MARGRLLFDHFCNIVCTSVVDSVVIVYATTATRFVRVPN